MNKNYVKITLKIARGNVTVLMAGNNTTLVGAGGVTTEGLMDKGDEIRRVKAIQILRFGKDICRELESTRKGFDDVCHGFTDGEKTREISFVTTGWGGINSKVDSLRIFECILS